MTPYLLSLGIFFLNTVAVSLSNHMLHWAYFPSSDEHETNSIPLRPRNCHHVPFQFAIPRRDHTFPIVLEKRHKHKASTHVDTTTPAHRDLTRSLSSSLVDLPPLSHIVTALVRRMPCTQVPNTRCSALHHKRQQSKKAKNQVLHKSSGSSSTATVPLSACFHPADLERSEGGSRVPGHFFPCCLLFSATAQPQVQSAQATSKPTGDRIGETAKANQCILTNPK